MRWPAGIPRGHHTRRTPFQRRKPSPHSESGPIVKRAPTTIWPWAHVCNRRPRRRSGPETSTSDHAMTIAGRMSSPGSKSENWEACTDASVAGNQRACRNTCHTIFPRESMVEIAVGGTVPQRCLDCARCQRPGKWPLYHLLETVPATWEQTVNHRQKLSLLPAVWPTYWRDCRVLRRWGE